VLIIIINNNYHFQLYNSIDEKFLQEGRTKKIEVLIIL